MISFKVAIQVENIALIRDFRTLTDALEPIHVRLGSGWTQRGWMFLRPEFAERAFSGVVASNRLSSFRLDRRGYRIATTSTPTSRFSHARSAV